MILKLCSYWRPAGSLPRKEASSWFTENKQRGAGLSTGAEQRARILQLPAEGRAVGRTASYGLTSGAKGDLKLKNKI